MGRRHTRKVTVNESVNSYLRYMYRGYLQIAAIDAVSGVFRWCLFWDPTQPTATRPLAIRKDSTWYAYGWDITKNITEIFGKAGYLRTVYSYTPYGTATADGDVTQPLTWSSEYSDEELALIYYNYRHYNPTDGRWINRDPIGEEGGINLYAFVRNKSITNIDQLGLYVVLCFAYCEGTIIGFKSGNRKKGIKITDVFSGNGYDANNCQSQHKLNRGPLPIGEYWIGRKYIPENHLAGARRGGNYNWYKLYGDDGNGGKSYENVAVRNPYTNKILMRGGFNLHTGRESDGCITVYSDIDDSNRRYPQSRQYDRLSSFIDQGATPEFKNPRRESDTFLGIMLVRKCLKNCYEALEKYN